MSDLDRKIKIARDLLEVFEGNSVYPYDEEFGHKVVSVHGIGDEFHCSISYHDSGYARIDMYYDVDNDTLIEMAGKIWGAEYFVESAFWPTGGKTYDGRPVSTGVYPRVSMSCHVYPDTETFILHVTNTYRLEELGKPKVTSDSVSLSKSVRRP